MIVAFHSLGWQSGKDTAADYMESRAGELGMTVHRTAFAWKMKLVCADALGIEGTDEEKVAAIDDLKLNGQVNYTSLRKDGRTGYVDGRNFIIGLAGDHSGANGIRRFQRDFWVRQALEDAPRVGADLYILSDCRFDEEAVAVHQNNGVVVEVVRDAAIDAYGGKRSEKGLSPGLVDFTIDNNGSLSHLANQVFELTYRLVPARLRP